MPTLQNAQGHAPWSISLYIQNTSSKTKLLRFQNVKKKTPKLTKEIVARSVMHSFTQTVFINAKYVPDTRCPVRGGK